MARTIINVPIVLFRHMDGSVAALEDRCCHRAAALHLGKVEGNGLRCMYHGMKFDGDGRCVDIPGQTTIPKAARVISFPVVELDNWIWVWMGDPELANPDMIPRGISPRDPNWNMITGSLTFKCDYRLIMDNLLDFSHVTYVHRKTFGGSNAYAETLPDITISDRSIHIERWVYNEPTPVFTWDAFGGPDVRIDMHYDYTLHLPCTFLMRFRHFTAGNVTDGPSNGQLVLDTWTSQGVTPVSEDKAQYYFSWGASSETDSPGIAPLLESGVKAAFREDRETIEAQHINIQRDPERAFVATGHDQAAMRMRRILDKALEFENSKSADAA